MNRQGLRVVWSTGRDIYFSVRSKSYCTHINSTDFSYAYTFLKLRNGVKRDNTIYLLVLLWGLNDLLCLGKQSCWYFYPNFPGSDHLPTLLLKIPTISFLFVNFLRVFLELPRCFYTCSCMGLQHHSLEWNSSSSASSSSPCRLQAGD